MFQQLQYKTGLSSVTRLNEQSQNILMKWLFFVIRIQLICVLNSFNCGDLLTVATPLAVEVGCQRSYGAPILNNCL